MELATDRGRVPLRYHQGEGRGLCVLYPGLHYGVELPFLYFSGRAARYLGYDLLEVPYQLTALPQRERGAYLLEVARTTLAWAQERTDRLLLVGKSAGTLVLAAGFGEVRVPAARVWLTPLLKQERVMGALKREPKGLLVAGSEDPLSPIERIEAVRHPGLEVLVLEGADHSLERDDPVPTVQGLAAYLEALLPFVQAALH